MLPPLRTTHPIAARLAPSCAWWRSGRHRPLHVAEGLKRYVTTPALTASGQPTIRELSGVVTVSDDGGSSGRLRKEFNMLPPGDVRNCIVALSEDEALLSRLFQHRFDKGSGLEGHSFGNLFLAALTSITGDFAEAIRLSSEILLTRGHIYPATMSSVELEASFEDGTKVRGETKITASKGKGRFGSWLWCLLTLSRYRRRWRRSPTPTLITIGPGSLFTSLIPNLLVRRIPQAIAESAAIKVFVCNLMTQVNESLSLTAADHILALNRHAGVQLFDYALINGKAASPEMKAKYALEGASQIGRIWKRSRRWECARCWETIWWRAQRHGTRRIAWHTT